MAYKLPVYSSARSTGNYNKKPQRCLASTENRHGLGGLLDYVEFHETVLESLLLRVLKKTYCRPPYKGHFIITYLKTIKEDISKWFPYQKMYVKPGKI
jgi:hypothetical protein